MIRRVALVVLFVLAAVGCLHFGACSCEEDSLKTGSYIVADIRKDRNSEWQWMSDARVHVDREEKFMTIRYTRDGTTYELRYEILDPTGPAE
jgi:hypothetical protein